MKKSTFLVLILILLNFHGSFGISYSNFNEKVKAVVKKGKVTKLKTELDEHNFKEKFGKPFNFKKFGSMDSFDLSKFGEALTKMKPKFAAAALASFDPSIL